MYLKVLFRGVCSLHQTAGVVGVWGWQGWGSIHQESWIQIKDKGCLKMPLGIHLPQNNVGLQASLSNWEGRHSWKIFESKIKYVKPDCYYLKICIMLLKVLMFWYFYLFNFSKLKKISRALTGFTSKLRPTACVISAWTKILVSEVLHYRLHPLTCRGGDAVFTLWGRGERRRFASLGALGP